MKTVNANLGLGDARPANRNKKVKPVGKTEWAVSRNLFFKKNVRLSAAAKATRTACEITQAEVAEYYEVTQGTVCNWESGKYGWPGGAQEMWDYQQVIQNIAKT